MRIRIPFDLLNDDSNYSNFRIISLLRFASMLIRNTSKVLKFSRGSCYRYVYQNNRYINTRYYKKYRHLEFPKGYKWVLVTLTLKRSIPICVAWANIGSWISRFLNRLRTYFYRRGRKIRYFWVIEAHKDGYPHVHILISFPFLPIEKLQSWWAYADPQGIDVRFIGSDVKQVRNYVLKYLLKGQYVDFYIDYGANYIEFGIIPFLLYCNRVRLFGRSRGILLIRFTSSKWIFIGYVDLHSYVLYDLRDRLFSFNLDYDTKELKSLLVSFLVFSGITFTSCKRKRTE